MKLTSHISRVVVPTLLIILILKGWKREQGYRVRLALALTLVAPPHDGVNKQVYDLLICSMPRILGCQYHLLSGIPFSHTLPRLFTASYCPSLCSHTKVAHSTNPNPNQQHGHKFVHQHSPISSHPRYVPQLSQIRPCAENSK